jgi:hypothetical protein
MMIQELPNERRRLWDWIEELERTCSPMHATTSSAIAIDPMVNPDVFIPPLSPLLHYRRVPYRMHRSNKSKYEPIFARFVYPHKEEPLGERLVWSFQNDTKSLNIAFEIPSRMTRSISTKSVFSRSFNIGKLMIKQNFNE